MAEERKEKLSTLLNEQKITFADLETLYSLVNRFPLEKYSNMNDRISITVADAKIIRKFSPVFTELNITFDTLGDANSIWFLTRELFTVLRESLSAPSSAPRKVARL